MIIQQSKLAMHIYITTIFNILFVSELTNIEMYENLYYNSISMLTGYKMNIYYIHRRNVYVMTLYMFITHRRDKYLSVFIYKYIYLYTLITAQ
jgi:hypothetical protein